MEETTNKGMAEEEHGVTFGAICRVIFQWKRLLIILLVTVICAAVSALTVRFAVNPSKTQYQATFTFHVARVSSFSDLYESGQFFAEEDTLTAVKNSDERFASVDVGSLLPGGKHAIKVALVTETREDGTTDSYYTIDIDEAVFKDKTVAEDFVRALIGFVKQDAVDETKALAQKDAAGFNGYQAQLKHYGEAQTYEEKLSLLVAQRDYLIGLCDGWTQVYGDLYYVEGRGISLVGLREAVRSSFSDTTYSELASELSANAYVPGGNDAATLQTRLNTYKEQLDLNTKKLQALEASLAGLVEQYKNIDGSASSLMPQFGEFHTRIAALIEQNAELQKKIETIEKLTGENVAEREAYAKNEQNFKSSLDEIYTALANQAEAVSEVAVELVTRESFTTVLSLGAGGGTNPVLVAVIVGIVALIISAAVVYVVASRREKGLTPTAPAEQTAPKEE